MYVIIRVEGGMSYLSGTRERERGSFLKTKKQFLDFFSIFSFTRICIKSLRDFFLREKCMSSKKKSENVGSNFFPYK